jgi:serine phosphatase RsbU (regulator of sigma subunit)
LKKDTDAAEREMVGLQNKMEKIRGLGGVPTEKTIQEYNEAYNKHQALKKTDKDMTLLG